ncbi:MAG: hypothetical protein QM765_40875 [Myxococcales bacterium]
MARKLLFVVFTNDPCKRNHAFLWAADLAQHGHHVRILLEGEGTQSLKEREGHFGELFEKARGLGLIAGACKAASAGCKDPDRDVTPIAQELGLELFDGAGGHASIAPFVDQGYEVVTF